MPGRYLSDTTARCQTITQTRFFTTYVDSCWTVPGWPLWNPWVIRIGNATVTPAGTAIQAVLPDPSSMFYISRTAVPSAINHVSLLVESVSNPVVISVVETVDGQEVVLGEQLLQAAQMSTVSFSITPSTPSIRVRVRWFTAPAILRWRTICVQVPQMQSETYLVDVCDEIGDKYRFGYNGQEKVNEMSGIGNHNTAEFWEYDTRVGRRWNLDPVDQISISNYAVNILNPIVNNDPNGDCPNCKDKPSGWVYTVQKNDNLTKIAKEHGMTVAQIKCINNLSPKSDVIHSGQQLKIEYTSPDWMKGTRGATEVNLLDVPIILVEGLINEAGRFFGLSEETSETIGKAVAITGGLVRGNPTKLFKETSKQTSRAARREAMRRQKIPTSQQPKTQRNTDNGREYDYKVPSEGGGSKTKSVQQKKLDEGHDEHWEAGDIKMQDGNIKTNRYGTPNLNSSKSKVDVKSP